jgi:hypothetical protein
MPTNALERAGGRLDAWLLTQPEWLRPAFYGAAMIPLLVLMRVRWLWPLALVALGTAFYRGQVTWSGTFRAVCALGLAMLGGAAGGLAYGVIGRPVRRVPYAGGYLAGVVSVAPYAVSIPFILRWSEHQPVWAPLDGAEIFATGLITLLFGLLIGHVLFKEPATQAKTSPEGSP